MRGRAGQGRSKDIEGLSVRAVVFTSPVCPHWTSPVYPHCTSPVRPHRTSPVPLHQEGEAFAKAASLDTHKALVHIFFAQRSTKKVKGITDAGLLECVNLLSECMNMLEF